MSTRNAPGGAHPQPLAPPSRDVVHHVIGCPPCGEGLSALGEDENVLGRLGGRRHRDRILFVEGVLSTAADVGKHRLGQVVYDMGRASLAMVPEVRQATRFENARPFATLQQDLALFQCLVGPGSVASERIPLSEPTAESALEVADDCGAVLQSLGCYREHATLLRAYTAIHRGEQTSAETHFRELLQQGSASPECTQSARLGLVRTLLKQDRLDEVSELSQGWITEDPTDRLLRFAQLMGLAAQSDAQGFDRASKDFTAIDPAPSEVDWWREYILSESGWLAAHLSRSEAEVREALGLPTLMRSDP